MMMKLWILGIVFTIGTISLINAESDVPIQGDIVSTLSPSDTPSSTTVDRSKYKRQLLPPIGGPEFGPGQFVNQQPFDIRNRGPIRYNPIEATAPIVRQIDDRRPDGSYHYEYDTGNGIHVQETNYQQGNDRVTRGSYSYIGPNGVPLTVNYIADRFGYRAYGDHLPAQPAPVINPINDGPFNNNGLPPTPFSTPFPTPTPTQFPTPSAPSNDFINPSVPTPFGHLTEFALPSQQPQAVVPITPRPTILPSPFSTPVNLNGFPSSPSPFQFGGFQQPTVSPSTDSVTIQPYPIAKNNKQFRRQSGYRRRQQLLGQQIFPQTIQFVRPLRSTKNNFYSTGEQLFSAPSLITASTVRPLRTTVRSVTSSDNNGVSSTSPSTITQLDEYSVSDS